MNQEAIGQVLKPGDFRMQDWLLNSQLSAGAKLTFSVLAVCAGGRDYAWPSQEILAENPGRPRRPLSRYLAGPVLRWLRLIGSTAPATAFSSSPIGQNLDGFMIFWYNDLNTVAMTPKKK